MRALFSVSWGRKFSNFVRQVNSTHLHSMTKYCQRLLNAFVGKPVSYCIVSFRTLPSASWLKWTCLIGLYPLKIPANSYFYVNNVDLLKQLSLDLIDAWQYFFHYQLDTNKQPLSQSNHKKIALTPYHFAGNFYLIWFVNCKQSKLIYTMPWIFHDGWLKW